MKSVAYRSILLSVLMITSSLAGCLGDDAEEIVEPIVDPQDEVIYGNDGFNLPVESL